LLEDFIRAIKLDVDPACSGSEGRRSIALVEAIYQAGSNSNAMSVSLK
jgi:hypothetical protein